MTGRFHDGMTLKEAREVLRTLVDEGHACPCCTQMAKVYKRKIHSTMARYLISVFRTHRGEWFHLPSERDASKLGGDFAKLAHWGLVEEETTTRKDGGRAGWWRVTATGARWVRCEVTVVKYARMYNGRRLSLVGESVTIRDALGSKFNYRELMEGL